MSKPVVVHLTFWDHAKGDGSLHRLIQCEVWGLLIEETPRELRVATWIAEGQADSHNSEILVIAKGTITERREFRGRGVRRR